MTTELMIEVTCAFCGWTSTQTEIGSTSTFGWPDLGTRASGDEALHHGILGSGLPALRLCCADIARATPDTLEVVRSEAYRRQQHDGEAPELVRRFLPWFLIQEATDDPVGAGWSSVHAAWACDDAGDGAAAARCRRRALDLFVRGE